jgi:hypothetical protein
MRGLGELKPNVGEALNSLPTTFFLAEGPCKSHLAVAFFCP